MSKKLMRLLAIGGLIMALALQLTGCGKTTKVSSAQKPEAITIGFQDIPNDEIVAKVKGFYETELGVKVNFKKFDSGRDVNNAFASNSIDFGLLGTTPAAVGIANGLNYEVFWIHDVIGAAESLAVKNTANVNSVKDLKGKRIAVPFSSTAHYSLLNALKLEGVSLAEVKILDMQPPDILAAWQRGDIDAAYVWNPVLGKLLADGKVITDSGKLAEKGIVTADLGIVSKSFAQKYPDLVTKYIKVQQKAYELYKNNPDDAAAALAKGLNIEKAEALKQAKELIWLSAQEEISDKYFGSSAKKGNLANVLKATADFLVEQKAIEKAPAQDVFEKAINPKYIENALK
ncbi:aliphatic sulfonate ABC transporter substrate-binding protein [Sporomusa sphaeroides]|uniref:Taurine-binding periplasmic protein n=1 Tax=Sporomusa sphaeroides DSM 2875 TaxID=1337886 RepID=A0ABM9W662_9FIRM|nr:aliphatic sulfonate ABC transporter substrate-binding protein [Sporomusa sphaeroides]OLS55144.1 taurine-binding periplasmic protein precursor [Sporomusa sphaeroides DSM 2875]CVK20518.1 Taurine-binding periplasmic protein precursor [Sporomusa sphaeroides DSM 2875]